MKLYKSIFAKRFVLTLKTTHSLRISSRWNRFFCSFIDFSTSSKDCFYVLSQKFVHVQSYKTLIIKRNPPLIFLPEIPAKLQNLSKTVYDWVLCIFLLFVHWSPYPTWGDKLTATRAVLECIFYDCNMQILIKTTRILTESLININVMNFTFSGRRALLIFMRAI